MAPLPQLLVIDNNPNNEETLRQAFTEEATLTFVTSVHEASDIIANSTVNAVIINADTYTINAAVTCAWLKGDPQSSQLTTIVLTESNDPTREFKYYESGADDVVFMPCPAPLLRHKVLRHTLKTLDSNDLYLASCALNQFYENTYNSQSLSHCMTECLAALQAMDLKAALHVCDHPELTCSSFGQVNDYEKSLLSYAECIEPTEESARMTFGDKTMAILIHNLPNKYHPLYASLTDWVKKIFNALSQKAERLLRAKDAKEEQGDEIPPAKQGAQRLHYFVERALNAMEKSCEQEIDKSIQAAEMLVVNFMTNQQQPSVHRLKNHLLELKETLLTNCMEIESRYMQFITERRAQSRLNIGW